MTRPMDEHLINDYADEAEEKGKLSAGKVANLLGEVWRARQEAETLRSKIGRVQEENARLRKLLGGKGDVSAP